MKLEVITGILLTLFLTGMLTLTLNIQPVEAEPRTWTVDDDGPADFSSIQEAINAASSGDTIIVSEGMYAEGQINVTKSLTILANGTAVVDGLGKMFVFNVVVHQVTVSGFTVMNGHHTGIFVTSDNCVITNNRVENITQTGILLFDSHFSVIENNTLLNNGDGMQIGHSTYNTVKKNRAIGKYAGMLISYSDFNSFESNTVSGGVYYGFRISERSRNNSVVENTVIDSNVGINIFGDSDYNNIYHNNFINNIKHASCSSDSINIWDDGYPSGGNYWSDYSGVDLYSGPYQNETGSDGIGDTPYVIAKNNTDNYPLMNPWRLLLVHNINTGLSYATIQEAINANETLNGHTIFVDVGTYYEHVVVNKSLSLIGKNKVATIIDGNMSATVVAVTADNVTISQFTIRNGGGRYAGISLSSNGNNITDNIL